MTVFSDSAAWSEREAWSIGDPITRIDDDRLYEVIGATLLRDELVVANSGTHELLFYDRTGTLIRTVGAEGEGPGEYRAISGMHRYRGDSLFIWDGRLQRASILDGAGAWVRSLSPANSAEYPLPQVMGVFSDGTLMAITNTFRAETAPGHNVHTADLVRYSPTGQFLNLVARSRFAITWRAVDVAFTWPLPFGPGLRYDTRGCELLYGFADSLRVDVVTCEGDSRYRFGARVPRLALPEEAHDALRAERIAEVEARPGTPLPALRRFVRDVPFPDSLPMLLDVTVDGIGNTWVTRYPQVGGDPMPREVLVFAPSGHWLGTLALPARANILAVTHDRVVLLARGELDTESLQVRPILRPSN